MQEIFIGDDICNFATITNPNNVDVSKVCVQIGTISKTFEPALFPLHVSLTSDETSTMKPGTNTMYVAVFTECGKLTSSNFLRFTVLEKQVLCGGI